jgi:hypothetical protein
MKPVIIFLTQNNCIDIPIQKLQCIHKINCVGYVNNSVLLAIRHHQPKRNDEEERERERERKS